MILTNTAAATASGVAAGVLTWAVQTHLAHRVRVLRAQYTPGAGCASFDPAAANLVVLADCARCVRHTAHEDDQHGTTRCVACHTTRITQEADRA